MQTNTRDRIIETGAEIIHRKGFNHTGIQEILTALPVGAIIWLAAGGIIFTLGAVVYITKTMDFVPGVFGFHEIWHIFVILGALAHFIMIAIYIAPLG